MTTRVIMVMVVTVSMFLAALAVRLQPWSSRGENTTSAAGTGFQGPYDPATVETISGNVESVDQIMPGWVRHYVIVLVLETHKESISAYLGPQWYTEKSGIEIKKGDKILVKGSRVTTSGRPAIMASEVEKGGAVVKLRDEAGVPLWPCCVR